MKTPSKLLQVAVIGAKGRMGQEIQKVLSAASRSEPAVGFVRGEAASGFKTSVSDLAAKELAAADVWIDFSSLENFSSVLQAARKSGRPLVSGTTGLSKSQFDELEEAGQKIPLLWSPNMSLGIAALRQALSVARHLVDYDFQIEEFHHRHKKDKPSGTGLYLQKELVKQVGREVPEPLAIRGGGIFGVHKVWMMSEEETLCFEHQALNRSVFAKGAVRAAEWLADRQPGLYTMDDLFAGLL